MALLGADHHRVVVLGAACSECDTRIHTSRWQFVIRRDPIGTGRDLWGCWSGCRRRCMADVTAYESSALSCRSPQYLHRSNAHPRREGTRASNGARGQPMLCQSSRRCTVQFSRWHVDPLRTLFALRVLPWRAMSARSAGRLFPSSARRTKKRFFADFRGAFCSPEYS